MNAKIRKEQNKRIYITLAVILISLATALGVAAIVGKRSTPTDVIDAMQTDDILEGENNEPANNTLQNTDDQVVFEDKTQNEADSEKTTEQTVTPEKDGPKETEKTNEDKNENIEVDKSDDSVLPEFSTPVSGYVINGHSESVPVFSITMNDYRTHSGVDVYALPGEAVRATADGVIGAIYEDPMMGTCMTVVHSGGAVSTYKGLYGTIPEGIVQGAAVKKGQAIAAVGDTALAEIAEESHVHYELAIDGVNVDPCLYMDFSEDIYEN